MATPWRERLREASWRGIRFHVEACEEGGLGRRVEVHTYPSGERPYTEDLGAAVRTWNVEALLVGEDYDTQLERLIRALRRPGPGLLQLWYGPAVLAVALPARKVENQQELGMARLALEFVEAGLDPMPSRTVDGRAAVDAAENTATDAVTAAFATAAASLQTVALLGEAMEDRIGDLHAALGSLVNSARGTAGSVVDAAAAVAALDADLVNLARQPENIADKVSSAIRAITDLPGYLTRAFSALGQLRLFGSQFPVIIESTATRAQEAANQAAFAALVRRLAAEHRARVAVRMSPASSQEAADLRDALVADLDAEVLVAGDAGEDETFATLSALKAVAVMDLDARAARLPTRISFFVPTTMPALVLSQRLYGTPDRAEEIVLRNNIAHPGFVPGGTWIEVLADV